MAIINLSHRGDTSFDKLLGHLPSVQEKWNALEDILKNEGQLSVDLKEEIRKILAQNSGCRIIYPLSTRIWCHDEFTT